MRHKPRPPNLYVKLVRVTYHKAYFETYDDASKWGVAMIPGHIERVIVPLNDHNFELSWTTETVEFG